MTRRRITWLIAVVLLTACGFVVWRSEVWVPIVYDVSYSTDCHPHLLDSPRRGDDSAQPFIFVRGRFLKSRIKSLFDDQASFWHENTGFKAYEHVGDNATAWGPTGQVRGQQSAHDGWYSPPWRWGVTDQEKPTPPAWLYRDELFEERR